MEHHRRRQTKLFKAEGDSFYGAVSTSVVVVANSLNLLDDWRILLYGPKDKLLLEPDIDVIEPQSIGVELSTNEGQSMQFIDLPAEPDQLITLGTGIVEGLSFTETQWTGAGAPFSRGQFVRLRSEMIRHELAIKGVRVTGKGMALCRHFASLSLTPSPLVIRCYES